MLELKTLAIVTLILLILYIIITRLPNTLKYRHMIALSNIPSATKSFWSEIKFLINLAKKRPIELLPFFTELIKKHGSVVHYYLPGNSVVILNDPDDIKFILSSTQHIKKSTMYEFVSPWLNEGLIMSTGSKWRSRRKILGNVFHIKNLEMYNVSINKHSQILVNKLLEASENNKIIPIIEYVSLCSLDIICETIMGTEMKAQEGKSVQYVLATKKIVIERVFNFWLMSDLIFNISSYGRTFYKMIKVLHDYSNKIIQKKRMSINNEENSSVQTSSTNMELKKKESFIDILFRVLKEHPDEMTDDDIREEVDNFLFAGHDTSSVSMTLTILLLGIYQDIQVKVRDELYEIFGDSNRDVTMTDLNDMKYLEAVIKESLRLYPSVPLFGRTLETSLQIKNYCIPPETIILMFPYILHRNEEIFSNPEEFIPERFLDDNNKSKFLSCYIPFSNGPRNCIGQKFAMNKMKTVISTILRKTRIETLGNKDDIQTSMQIVLTVESAPNVKFYKI